MNKQEFLDRCSTAYDAGYITDRSIVLLRDATEYIMRVHGGQEDIAHDIMMMIQEYSKGTTLANFTDLYKAEQFGYLLCHPCDKCANDKNAWHTRYSFCDHK